MTGCVVHPGSCSVGIAVLSRTHSGQGVRFTTHPHLAPRLRMSGVQPLLLASVLSWPVHGQLYFLFNSWDTISITTSVSATWPLSSGLPTKFILQLSRILYCNVPPVWQILRTCLISCRLWFACSSRKFFLLPKWEAEFLCVCVCFFFFN
jgi:hypothetical protein